MPTSALGLLALLTATQLNYVNALTFDCNQVVIGDNKFDLSKLGGPHSVFWTQRTPTAVKNTTFTIDICKPLYKSGDKPKTAECPNGSRGELLNMQHKAEQELINLLPHSMRAGTLLPS